MDTVKHTPEELRAAVGLITEVTDRAHAMGIGMAKYVTSDMVAARELIAAAPDMLDALRGLILMRDLFEVSDRNQQDAYYLLAKQDTSWALARAVLAKAAGQS